jgi:hypothetical protein
MKNRIISIFLIYSFALFAIPNAFAADAQSSNIKPPAIKLNGGLEGEIVTVGRSKDRHELSVSMTLSNKGKNAIQLLLLSTSFATDSTGASFSGDPGNTKGITLCNISPSTECIKMSPIQTYTQIDPDTSITANFKLHSYENSTGPLASFSANVAYRIIDNPVAENGLTEDQQRKQVHVMSWSFPPTPVVEASQ